MGKHQVTVRYERVEKRPRKKHRRWIDEIPMPSGLSPLARYVEGNMGEGVTPQELVQQFQEYECTHSFFELAVSPNTIFDYCTNCGQIKKKRNRRK